MPQAAGWSARSKSGGPPNSVVFSPDGARLLAGSYNALKLWDVASGQLVRSVKTPTPDRVAFSADGDQAASQHRLDHAVDPEAGCRPDGRPIGRQPDRVGRSQRPADPCLQSATGPGLQASGRVLARRDPVPFRAPATTSPLKVWDVASGQVVHTFGGRATNFLQSVAFSPDGAQVVSGHIDGALKLWEVASGRLVRTLWHSKSVAAVAFSRDGSKLLSGSDDTTVKLWDAATGQLIRTFEGHSASVRSVAFSPDEKRVISGSYDTTARVWDAATGELLAILLTAKTTSGLPSRRKGFFDASPKGAEMLTVVRGLEVFSIDQFYQALYRPDLVREKLAGDPDGKVRDAAAKLDLAKLVDSGRVPNVAIISHKAQDTSPTDLVTVEARARRPGRRHRPGRVAHQRHHRRRGRASRRRRQASPSR